MAGSGPRRQEASRQAASAAAERGEKQATIPTETRLDATATAIGSRARTTRSPTAVTSRPVRARMSPRRIDATVPIGASASLA